MYQSEILFGFTFIEEIKVSDMTGCLKDQEQ